jgi:hypothetical protein
MTRWEARAARHADCVVGSVEAGIRRVGEGFPNFPKSIVGKL